MPRYKLTFFQGRGEFYHCMFALANVDYQFRGLTMEEWKSVKAGFHSNNSQEEYKIQMMIVAACDLLEKLVAIYFQGAKKTKKFHEEFLPLWLNVLEKSYQDGGSPYCVNDTLTLGDLYFYFAAKSFLGYKEYIFHQVQGLHSLYQRIASNAKIAAWREKNSKPEF
ncbi:hypothetical protein TrispH2_011844 [Trichoplax sp. H2]|nr:hypothetical protein TrispH2_011844 [Trichoplax sp. H2]|eukprot:RDD36163.1 hypothetical protein TrispH2_011844 [Trichoplax sp. H2]